MQHRAFKRVCSFVTIAACASSFFWSSTVQAQASEIAKKLLDEAKTLREAGKISAACPLLDRSYELDAKDGVLFARADCRDNERKISAAVSLYEAYLRAYSRMTGTTKQNHSSRAAIADGRIKELQPLVPMVKFIWAEKPPEDTLIKVDGVEYRASTLESKLPLEPGTHEIVVLLPGEKERRRTVTLAEGGSTVVDLTPLAPQDPTKTVGLGGNGAKKGSGSGSLVKPGSVDPLKVGGFVGIGLGVAGIAVGSVFGGLAVQEKPTVDAHCNDLRQCDETGLAAAERLQTAGNTSTAAIIAGGVIGGVGATLLVLAYRHPATTAKMRFHVGSNGAQLGIEGTF